MKTIIHILTSIHTMEQFEELKQTATIFEEAVKLILNRHHLPLKSLSIFLKEQILYFHMTTVKLSNYSLPSIKNTLKAKDWFLKHSKENYPLKLLSFIMKEKSLDGLILL